MIHAKKGEKKAATLKLKIREQLPEIRIIPSESMSDLTGELGRPLNNISVIIMFIPTLKTLDLLFSLKSFFENKKLILVLAGQDNQTFIRGLQLNPSFISTGDVHGDDVFRVLKRINQRQRTMTQISMHLNKKEEI